MTFNLDLMSALAGIVGVAVAASAQLVILTRRNRLRSRLRQAIELKKTVAAEPGEAPQALASTLDDVIAYSARELTAIEAAWVRRVAASPLARLELLVLMGGVLLGAGVLSGLGLVAFGTSDRYAAVVSLVVVVVTLLAVVRYERGLKRAVAEVTRGGGPARYPGRWIRYVIGVDETVLAAFPGDVVRLTRLGFMTLISALLPALALWSALGAAWDGGLSALAALLGIGYAAYHLATDRAVMSAPPPTGWGRLRLVPIVAVSVLATLVLAEPLLLAVLAHQIAHYLPAGRPPGLLDRVRGLDAAERHVSVLAIVWSVRLALIVVAILPVVVRLLSKTTPYDLAARARATDPQSPPPPPALTHDQQSPPRPPALTHDQQSLAPPPALAHEPHQRTGPTAEPSQPAELASEPG